VLLMRESVCLPVRLAIYIVIVTTTTATLRIVPVSSQMLWVVSLLGMAMLVTTFLLRTPGQLSVKVLVVNDVFFLVIILLGGSTLTFVTFCRLSLFATVRSLFSMICTLLLSWHGMCSSRQPSVDGMVLLTSHAIQLAIIFDLWTSKFCFFILACLATFKII
jgi:hypothetical protein